jgi:NADPH-dependent glutamate synthase beta subunit-like oxidoreductase
LESREEMPAFDSEIGQFLEKGSVLHPSWGPKRIVANGKVNGIELVRCTRVFDDSKRFNPAFDPSVTTVLETDTVILAIGQSTDLSFLAEADRPLVTERGTIRVDESTLTTPVAGVLAGGEAVSGPSSVIQTIATGRKAAVSIDRQLGGDGVIDETLAPASENDPLLGHEYEEAPMYTQRESELLQHFLQEHGRLPAGNDLGDDLF